MGEEVEDGIEVAQEWVGHDSQLSCLTSIEPTSSQDTLSSLNSVPDTEPSRGKAGVASGAFLRRFYDTGGRCPETAATKKPLGRGF